MANRKLSKAELALARTEYMSYTPIVEIADKIGCKPSTLQWHVSEKWKAERQLMENEMIAEFGHTRAAKLNLLAKYSSDIIVKALENLKKRDRPPSMVEARAAVTIFESLDKIMRLDKGSPTDIISNTKPITIVELRKEFESLDPFHDNKEENEIVSIEAPEKNN